MNALLDETGYPPRGRRGNIDPPPAEGRLCAECVYRERHGKDLCMAPEVWRPTRTLPVATLVTGVSEEWQTQDFDSLHVHRAAGWLSARLNRLCGREGRWWSRDPKTLTPPNCSGSGVKPPPSQFEKRLGV